MREGLKIFKFKIEELKLFKFKIEGQFHKFYI